MGINFILIKICIFYVEIMNDLFEFSMYVKLLKMN